jgi:hypothetical protein
MVAKQVTEAWETSPENPGIVYEGVASGKVSPGVATTVTPSSARVDDLRNKMTGFFDDFNTPAGAFDELKWNNAPSACNRPGDVGAFVNTQFHAHSQVRSSCDRTLIVNRPRAVFDITGRTESNPGVIVADADGLISGRDVWYIDMIPVDVRKDGAPMDITPRVDDAVVQDPMMIRLHQNDTSLSFTYVDSNKESHDLQATYTCGGWNPNVSDMSNCTDVGDGGSTGRLTPSLSPLPLPLTTYGCPPWPYGGGPSQTHCPSVIPNLRRHWVIQVSDTKIKVFIDGYRVWEGNMPSAFANIKKYVIHNNVFSYNTGKENNNHPTTEIMHWDNFGFNGPAPTTVVHNYLEGGTTGTVPYFGVGTPNNLLPENDRATKINIPDPIATPTKARLMFTLQEYGYQDYVWNADDNVVINGKKYAMPNPAALQQGRVAMEWGGDGNIAATTGVPYPATIFINAADLKQGMNDVQFNLDNSVDIFSVHMELEYTKGTEPSYTQPKNIFGVNLFNSVMTPVMRSHDSYLFVEQDFGLPSVLDIAAPDPNPTGDTTDPTITLNTPANNLSVTAGTNIATSASASDNVGVTKVEFYLGGILKASDTSSPYSTSISTTGLSPGTYPVHAIAYDAAGNTANSTVANVIIQQPPDTTAPTVGITAPVANTTITGTSVTIQAGASDNIGVTKVEFYIDNNIISTDTSEPYAATLDSTKQTNGNHTLTAKAYDAAGNVAPSPGIAVTVNNTVADTTNPTVSISAPTANATISGSLAFIQATASDNVMVTKVEFYMDGTLLGTDTTTPYSFSLNTTLYPNGTHNLTAKAFDSSNNSKVSSAVTVTINNVAIDSTPPSVILTAPTDGATISGTYNISANAADANGVTKVEFLVDGTVKATDTSLPYSYAFDTKTISNASHTISAKAYDTAGLSQSATATVTVNNTVTPPTSRACDFNGDGTVGIQDLVILVSNYGKTVTAGKNGDCTNDGKVGIQDLVTLIGEYGL